MGETRFALSEGGKSASARGYSGASVWKKAAAAARPRRASLVAIRVAP
jgi:hypothetical protein